MIDNLDVILWDAKVGTLVSAANSYSREICFYFNPDFVRNGYDIAPLRAPLNGVVAQKGLPVYPDSDKIFCGLPSFIADSMPDHWGNVVFREWAKANNLKSKDISSLDRLAYIGKRGMGAFEFEPSIGTNFDTPFKVEIAELSKLAQMALNEAKGFKTILSLDLVLENLFKVGTSAGGKRPKAVINVNLQSGECYSGQVATPLPGYTPMIIKFDEHCNTPTTRIEYSYYLMALDAGLNMMPSQLIKGENETHFLTERFDRQGHDKVHVQTLAAMNPLAVSYEDLFDVAQRLGVLAEEMQLLFCQMVMNVLGANVDDHSKNFSFTLRKGGYWHIAPMYDYTFTVEDSFYYNRHSMSINGVNHAITMIDLMAVARMYNIKGASAIVDRCIDVVKNYRNYAIKAEVEDRYIRKIEDEIASRIEALHNRS